METQEMNDFLIKKLDAENESLKYTIQALVESYSTNSMLLQILIDNKKKLKEL
jgi:hypothetical protein